MNFKEIARTLSSRRSSSTRDFSSSILRESLTSDSLRFTKYENLNQSLRFEGLGTDVRKAELQEGVEISRNRGFRSSFWKKKFKTLSLNGRSPRKDRSEEIGADQSDPSQNSSQTKGKVKRRSSWLPDPNRRWPVQGW
eukprot:TRINITY_DN13998_c0_g1_i1.p1 TRINITY_DN13998_c0_g1~~TRINITY_DN13998_c0_g1_i1.p1  ORF type:complete len:138 (+),score=13.74 TRINITY_DN13998_c0_g1_i1:303-716(+)